MKIDNFQVTDDPGSDMVRFTYTVPWHELALPTDEERGIIEASTSRRCFTTSS